MNRCDPKEPWRFAILRLAERSLVFSQEVYTLSSFDWPLRLVERSKRPFSRDIVGLSVLESRESTRDAPPRFGEILWLQVQ